VLTLGAWPGGTWGKPEKAKGHGGHLVAASWEMLPARLFTRAEVAQVPIHRHFQQRSWKGERPCAVDLGAVSQDFVEEPPGTFGACALRGCTQVGA
jgi:hypothetical protein